jgi:hypothetical protein
MKTTWIKTLVATSLAAGLVLATPMTWAADALPAPVQAKTEQYKKKLVEWAANPVIVAAVKEVNATGGVAGMTNGKWNDLDEKDPVVKSFETSKAGTLIRKWEEDTGINKLLLRDEKGNLVASSGKPLVYNNAARPAFANPFKGQVWAASEIRPDPTTGIKSVQAGAPVMDGGKVIGVIHVGITAE